MRWDGRANAAIVITGLLFTGWCVGRAQERESRPAVRVFQAEAGMQVVLETVPTTDGKLWVRPKTPVYFRLVPKNPADHYAPLPPHSLMICREFNYKDEVGSNHAAFLCGQDSYALDAFGFAHDGDTGDGERRHDLGRPAGGLL